MEQEEMKFLSGLFGSHDMSEQSENYMRAIDEEIEARKEDVDASSHTLKETRKLEKTYRQEINKYRELIAQLRVALQETQELVKELKGGV